MANKTYSEKLKDPRWQKKRLKILERDQWICKLFGDSNTTLHVHHEKYKGDPWSISDDHLTSVCQHCHGIIEFLKTDFPPTKVERIIKHRYKEENENYLIFVLLRGGKRPAIATFELIEGTYTLTGLLFQDHIDSIIVLNKDF